MRLATTAVRERAIRSGLQETPTRSALAAPARSTRVQLAGITAAKQLPGYPPGPPDFHLDPYGGDLAFLNGVIQAVDIAAIFARSPENNPLNAYAYAVDGTLLLDPTPIHPYPIVVVPHGDDEVSAEVKTDDAAPLLANSYISRAAERNLGPNPVRYFLAERASGFDEATGLIPHTFVKFLLTGVLAAGATLEIPPLSIALDLPKSSHAVKLTRGGTVLVMQPIDDFTGWAGRAAYEIVGGW